MDTRWVMIEKPEEDTCEWIFSDPNYMEWRAGKQKILWIKGKPGSGKSVLMKRMFEVTEKESQKSGTYVAKFFINGRGNIMERTMSGLLKSLIFQLLKQHKMLLSHVLQRFLDKQLKQGDQLNWEVGELKELLLWGTRHGKESVWIIDALDEFAAEELEHLVGFLEDIVATADTTVRVCLSSRRYPNITAKDCLEVDMDVGSYVDVQKFLERKLNDAEKSYRVPKDSIRSLKIQLDDRADGVFLWARLTVEGLLSGIRNGDSLESMSETIKFTPSKLEDIYRELVSDIIAKGSTVETIWLVQWVLYAERPLTLTEIRHALSCDHDIKDDDQMERWIKARARDLIEIRPGKAQGMQAPKIVQFIHQTVKDYFFRLASLHELRTPFKGLSAGNAQLNLMLNCLMFMRNRQFPIGNQSPMSSRQCSAENRFPRQRQPFWEDSFLEYADQSWLSHAQNAESLGVMPADIATGLKRLLEDKEKCDRWGYFSCTDQQSKDFRPEGSFIVVAVRYNLLSHVETFLSINHCRGTEGFRESISGHWSLLGTAAGEGFVEMVQLLLRYKVEVNPYNPTWSTLGWKWQSPIDEAILNGHREVVCFLVENGASLATQPDSQKPNPFQVAIMADMASMVELLIHLGVDVNAPGFSGQKPIEDAAERGSVDSMRVLLTHKSTPTLYALHLAVRNNQRAAVNILKEYGIQVHPSDVRWGVGIAAFKAPNPAAKATLRQQARDIWV
jgi:ankyrin repeat protein